MDLKEGIASVIFAAPRCSEIPELGDLKDIFEKKYGRDFVSAATDLRPTCGVNRMVSNILLLELVFWQSGVDHFSMGFSTETSVGKTGIWARCNRHHEHYELVYLIVKIQVILKEKWISKNKYIKSL